jgi:pimeloyl-ACP methyl ester carboxylesterase
MANGANDDLPNGADGAVPLPMPDASGRVDHDGARLWYTSYGSGSPVILVHGAMSSSEDWGNQVPALVESGRRVILIDSRGHGRSTRDGQPLSYELMASDVVAVMDHLGVEKAAVVGWSDGAIIGVTMAMKNPARVARVFAFAGNTDLNGVKTISPGDPLIAALFDQAAKAYARLSETPGEFATFRDAMLRLMGTQPNYSAGDLAGIRVPVAVVHGEHDEFIKREHAEYVARSIPGATLVVLPGVSHFAPRQNPQQFNEAMAGFLGEGS